MNKNECDGCEYSESTDMKIHVEYCNYCKRNKYDEFERDIHEDFYIKAGGIDERHFR